ncbi:hypothetical protein ACFPVT_07010 [Corynebacterium choanae]|nr:hypothetical protein [Corynebacterium choanae]
MGFNYVAVAQYSDIELLAVLLQVNSRQAAQQFTDAASEKVTV